MQHVSGQRLAEATSGCVHCTLYTARELTKRVAIIHACIYMAHVEYAVVCMRLHSSIAFLIKCFSNRASNATPKQMRTKTQIVVYAAYMHDEQCIRIKAARSYT